MTHPSPSPFPARKVFTLRTAPALLAAGHSTRAFRGGMQRIDPATLNDAAAVRVASPEPNPVRAACERRLFTRLAP